MGAIASSNYSADRLRQALEAPLRQIVDNAGQEPSVIVQHVREAAPTVGYDASSGEMGDMFKLGIVDPVKVVRVALESAVSVSALMLVTVPGLQQVIRRMKSLKRLGFERALNISANFSMFLF